MGPNCLTFLTFIVILQTCFAPPVTQNKKEEAHEEGDSQYGGLEDYMEYHRYLKEVVNALESDPEFRQKLEKADENEIKSGKIAEELQFVSHHVRSRLDEIKRIELQRLRELTEKKMRLEQQSNSIDEDPTHHHLDQHNPHTFEIEDLKKLIAKTTQDLAEADKMRRDEFKQYEMEKEYQKQEKLNHTENEAERQKLEQEFQTMEEKHNKHEKLHEPGHKAQLEEVWEEQDQMQQDFDPKTFFMLHDMDGNGLWDQEEVKALFIKELDKMYQQGATEDDMRERVEEMERMRESVFHEMDTNRDGFIDYMEFLRQTKTNDFQQDHGWQSLDQQTKPYTDEELAEYIRRHHGANQIPQYGNLPPSPQGAYHQVPQGAYPPPGAYQVPPNQQFHPGQMPQMAPQNLNTNEVYPGQQPQYQQQYHNPPQVNYQQAGQQNVPQQPNYIPVNQQQPGGNNQQGYVQGGQQNVPQQQYQQNVQGGQQNIHQQQYQQNVPQQPNYIPVNQQQPGGNNQQGYVQGGQQNVPQQQYQQNVPQPQGNINNLPPPHPNVAVSGGDQPQMQKVK